MVILPFPYECECIISIGRRLFFGCVDDRRRASLLTSQYITGDQGWTPSNHGAKTSERHQTIGVSLHHRSLLTVQVERHLLRRNSARLAFQRFEPVTDDNFVDLDPNPLNGGELREIPNRRPHLNTEVKVGVMSCDDPNVESVIIVAHRNGSVEMFVAKPGLSLR